MIWVDRIVKQLRGKPQHIDDMFTPSGIPHLGSLRGPILHDVVYRAFLEKNKQTVFTYVFNDFDPIDGLPKELQTKFSKYLGFPLRLAPSPKAGYKSFGEYYMEELKKVLSSLGVKAKYLSSWDMYREGKFNEVIKIALDNKDKILEVYRRVGGYQKKAEDWYPLQVICPKCSRLGTTKVTAWNGKTVTFRCEKDLVSWAKGCGYTGELSPFDGNAKLPWKVDWPAHWKVMGVTFEGAGKDHASRGGSYDIAFELCSKVFNYPKPFYFPYEFFLFGGKKMSSSKGVGISSTEITKVLPAEVFRFLIVRTTPERAIEFDPYGDTVPDLFDDYDRCLNAYFDKLEGKIPEKKAGEVLTDFARIAELSAVRPLPDKRLFLPRFRTIVNLIKTRSDLLKHFAEQKGQTLNPAEKEILKERETYAQKYLAEYMEPNKQETTKQPAKLSLTKKQKDFLTKLAVELGKQKKTDRETIQSKIFEVLKSGGFQAREVFPAFYQVLTGQDSGPKAADLILSLGVKETVEKLKKI